jgi:hypothetical protein
LPSVSSHVKLCLKDLKKKIRNERKLNRLPLALQLVA